MRLVRMVMRDRALTVAPPQVGTRGGRCERSAAARYDRVVTTMAVLDDERSVGCDRDAMSANGATFSRFQPC